MAKPEVYVEVSTSPDPKDLFAKVKLSDRKDNPTVTVEFDSSTGCNEKDMSPAQVKLMEHFDYICKESSGQNSAPFVTGDHSPENVDIGRAERNESWDKAIEIAGFGTIHSLGYTEIEYDDGYDAKGNGLGGAVGRQGSTHITIQTPWSTSKSPEGAVFLKDGKGLVEIPPDRFVELDQGEGLGYGEDRDGKLAVKDILQVRFRGLSDDPSKRDGLRLEIHDPSIEASLTIDSNVGLQEKSLSPKEHAILSRFRETIPHSVTTNVDMLDPDCIQAVANSVPHEDRNGPTDIDYYGKPRNIEIKGIGSIQLDYCRGNFSRYSEGNDKWVDARLFPEGGSNPEECIHFQNVAGGKSRGLQAYIRRQAIENPGQEQGSASKRSGVER